MKKHLALPVRLVAALGLAVALTAVVPGTAQAAPWTYRCHYGQAQLPHTADAVTPWYATCVAKQPVLGPWH